MIKFDNGSVRIEGSKIDLVAELVCIMRFFIEKGVLGKHDLVEYSILAGMSKEDVKQAVIDTIDEMDNIGDALTLLQALERI